MAFKVDDEALFPASTRAQRMPSRPTSSLLGLGLGLGLGLVLGLGLGLGLVLGLGLGSGLGSPSWFTRLVLQTFLGLKDDKIFQQQQ